MEQIYISRQEILDSSKETQFYEVSSSRGFKFYSDDEPTQQISFQEISDIVSESYISSFSNNKKLIVTVPVEELTVKKMLSLPKEMMCVQVKLPKQITVNTIKKMKLLKEKGYTIVLDHFRKKSKLAFHLMPYCDILKINHTEFDDDELKNIVDFLSSKEKQTIAVNVHSHAEHKKLSDMGIDYFSGNYLAKPIIVKNKKLDSFKPNSMKLLELITTTPIDFGALNALISKDIVFTYKLMKYVNSSYFMKEKNISDVKYAIAYLGEKEIKKWAFILLSSSLGEDKPDELMIKALTKARFCETVAAKMDDVDADKAFIMGIFSYLELLTNIPFNNLAVELAMDADIVSAITTREGSLGTVFELATIYERCRWDLLKDFINNNDLAHLKLSKYYFDTVTWVNEVMA